MTNFASADQGLQGWPRFSASQWSNLNQQEGSQENQSNQQGSLSTHQTSQRHDLGYDKAIPIKWKERNITDKSLDPSVAQDRALPVSNQPPGTQAPKPKHLPRAHPPIAIAIAIAMQGRCHT